MIFDSLNIAATSLKAQQKAMDVVSHNIANVNTAGYSRQTTDVVSMASQPVSGLNFGRGVEVNGVRRIIDPIINQAELNNATKLTYWTTQHNGLSSVENVFGSLQSTGLASALDNFFLSFKQLANNPQDNGHKVNVRAKSTSVINSLVNMRDQLVTVQANTNANIDQSITKANQILDHIAALSAQIHRQEVGSKGTSGQANDLRDQRDQALRDLSKIVPTQHVTSLDGSFLVQTLDGNLLTQDNIARHLSRGTSGTGSFTNIVIAGTNTPIANTEQGGQIGAMIDLRDNKLGGYISNIDSLAANLIFSVNQLHANGASIPQTRMTASQSGNASLTVNHSTQTAPFAAQIKTGSFNLHVYDSNGVATTANIAINASTSSLNSIVTSINTAAAGVTAAVDSAGHLTITGDTVAGKQNTFSLSGDTSNFLAAYEINTFFSGSTAGTIGLSSAIQNNAGLINTGKIDPATSNVQLGDNSIALAILALQNSPLNVDGSTAASLHDRTTSLSTQFGTDVGIAKQQTDFRTIESQSLLNQKQAVSGVNIDEELIAMLKFQRAYQASAKVITTSNQMLDSLMGLIR